MTWDSKLLRDELTEYKFVNKRMTPFNKDNYKLDDFGQRYMASSDKNYKKGKIYFSTSIFARQNWDIYFFYLIDSINRKKLLVLKGIINHSENAGSQIHPSNINISKNTLDIEQIERIIEVVENVR